MQLGAPEVPIVAGLSSQVRQLLGVVVLRCFVLLPAGQCCVLAYTLLQGPANEGLLWVNPSSQQLRCEWCADSRSFRPFSLPGKLVAASVEIGVRPWSYFQKGAPFPWSRWLYGVCSVAGACACRHLALQCGPGWDAV